MELSSLIACHECDLLQKRVALPPRGVGRCSRCSAVLYRDIPNGIDRALACTIGSLILFLIANAYPIVGLEVQGNRTLASLSDTLHTLWDDGREDVAILVGVTTMVAPAIQIGLLLYLLFPLHFNRLAEGAIPVLRVLQTVKTWSMMEVFMIGILVALTKLEHIAHVHVGIALWAFGALIPLLIVSISAFNPDEIWARVKGAA
jgi:paraquat-inducible protein A